MQPVNSIVLLHSFEKSSVTTGRAFFFLAILALVDLPPPCCSNTGQVRWPNPHCWNRQSMGDFRGELGDPDLVRFYDYWLSLCRGRPMPSRKDIDPLQIPPAYLPNLMLIDVLHNPRRYKYRLIGTHVVAASGEDRTGRIFDNVDFLGYIRSSSSSTTVWSTQGNRCIRWSRSRTSSAARPTRSIGCCCRSPAMASKST